nr:hypothetical protein HK105_005109 [Polyrhizophydium stewartii]
MHAKFVEEVQRTNAGGRRVVRRGVAVTVPVAAGGTVFSEDPIIAGLEIDSEMAVMSMAQAAMSCTHCLKPVGADSSTVADVVCPRCSAAFCSQECRDNGERLHHRMLCRDVAPAFFGLCTAEHDTPALLTAMFLTKMVDKELSQKKPESKYDDWDHLERMHDIRPELGDKERLECSLLKDLIAPGVSGFEAFLKEDRYLFIKSKIMHNAIAVPASGHTEAAVRAKTLASPGKTLRGRALYHITTFVSHSCEPNVAIRLMPETGARMSLVALKDLEPSEELFVSYVDPDMPYEQRKAVIRQQFGFVCKCAKCKRRE